MSVRTRAAASALLALLAGAAALAQDPVPAARIVSPQDAQDVVAKEPVGALYDVNADAREQIAGAVAKAKKENQRVLIQWGGNWCPWCIKLAELYKSNAQVARQLLYEYVVVHIDAGKPAGKNVDLAETYGADLKKHGYPFLTILDASGKPLANQESSALEIDGKDVSKGHDAQKLMALLTRYQADAQDAQKALSDGLDQARKSGKRAFVHFGAPWCVWCHRLEGWMAQTDVQPLLGKEFVDLKIDIDRMTGGKDVLARYSGTKGAALPWFAFLDADGKVLATSSGESGTSIGFPAAPPEIEHFEKMLKAGVKNLSGDDIAKLVASLRDTPEAHKAAAQVR